MPEETPEKRVPLSVRVHPKIKEALRDAAYWDRETTQDIVEAALLRELGERAERRAKMQAAVDAFLAKEGTAKEGGDKPSRRKR